jgi:hypothetical protein
MKIRPVWADLFHAEGRTDGQTDMTELRFAFRNFVNAPKNVDMHVKPNMHLDLFFICFILSGLAFGFCIAYYFKGLFLWYVSTVVW